mmetsp:Transcript_1927/g.5452  ORF Transcript_1927/g.5452 Transcript_1927/m.5452 type:complete len:300 (+) Transcript_1927:790-1689(+)
MAVCWPAARAMAQCCYGGPLRRACCSRSAHTRIRCPRSPWLPAAVGLPREAGTTKCASTARALARCCMRIRRTPTMSRRLPPSTASGWRAARTITPCDYGDWWGSSRSPQVDDAQPSRIRMLHDGAEARLGVRRVERGRVVVHCPRDCLASARLCRRARAAVRRCMPSTVERQHTSTVGGLSTQQRFLSVRRQRLEVWKPIKRPAPCACQWSVVSVVLVVRRAGWPSRSSPSVGRSVGRQAAGLDVVRHIWFTNESPQRQSKKNLGHCAAAMGAGRCVFAASGGARRDQDTCQEQAGCR